MAPQGFDDAGAKGNIGDKMPIHNIEVEPIGRLDQFRAYLKKTEVSSKDPKRNLDFTVSTAFQRLLQPPATVAGTAGTAPHRVGPSPPPPERRSRVRCGGGNRETDILLRVLRNPGRTP